MDENIISYNTSEPISTVPTRAGFRNSQIQNEKKGKYNLILNFKPFNESNLSLPILLWRCLITLLLLNNINVQQYIFQIQYMLHNII